MGLPDVVGWTRGVAELSTHREKILDGALLIAWELLDVVPCSVLEADEDGAYRVVLVDPVTGREHLDGPPSREDEDWCRRWWPWTGAVPGNRIEVGLSRDRLWALLVEWLAGTARGGLALAVDYFHVAGQRPPSGTLMGFHRGRVTPPIPDGSRDVTAHVAMDSAARAGQASVAKTRGFPSGGRAGDGPAEGQMSTGSPAVRGTETGLPGIEPVLLTQAEALRRLGVGERTESAHPRPTSGAAVLAALQARSQAAELLDPGGLGGFGWLMQPAGVPIPDVLAGDAPDQRGGAEGGGPE
jgi:SAM-dependent MidA family methyltransferase